ncbi:hypothetical protein BHM03_00027284 [Ensete ventricosum]|nr:hypothetical protein BHM03_00027284 [Ensete ventricosum]
MVSSSRSSALSLRTRGRTPSATTASPPPYSGGATCSRAEEIVPEFRFFRPEPPPPFRHPVSPSFLDLFPVVAEGNWRWRGDALPEASTEEPLALHPCLDGRYLLLSPDSDFKPSGDRYVLQEGRIGFSKVVTSFRLSVKSSCIVIITLRQQ